MACQHRDYRLALLLSQASGDVQIKHMLREQLSEWKDQGVCILKAAKYWSWGGQSQETWSTSTWLHGQRLVHVL